MSARFTVGLSPRHFGQNHLPFGLFVSPTQLKWNHSMAQLSLSQPIISPYDTWKHARGVRMRRQESMSEWKRRPEKLCARNGPSEIPGLSKLTCSHRQYVGSSGSMNSRFGDFSPVFSLLFTLRFFFFFGLSSSADICVCRTIKIFHMLTTFSNVYDTLFPEPKRPINHLFIFFLYVCALPSLSLERSLVVGFVVLLWGRAHTVWDGALLVTDAGFVYWDRSRRRYGQMVGLQVIVFAHGSSRVWKCRGNMNLSFCTRECVLWYGQQQTSHNQFLTSAVKRHAFLPRHLDSPRFSRSWSSCRPLFSTCSIMCDTTCSFSSPSSRAFSRPRWTCSHAFFLAGDSSLSRCQVALNVSMSCSKSENQTWKKSRQRNFPGEDWLE